MAGSSTQSTMNRLKRGSPPSWAKRRWAPPSRNRGLMRFAPALRAALLAVLTPPRRSLGPAVGFALLASACRGGAAETVNQSGGDIEMAGVDTREFTAREKHEFSRYMREFPAPCLAVAVPLAQCVLEKRSCRSCVPAAIAVAEAV